MRAKGSRNCQKKIVPKMTIKKMESDRTCWVENPAKEDSKLNPRMINM
jgi:hypothetical protein